jgi:serine/threonine-protein kinase RsbW
MNASGREHCRVLKVKAETAELGQVRRFVEEMATEAALDGERVFDLKVAVSEACANAMEHSGCEAVFLEVRAKIETDRLTFIVSDSGLFRPPCPPRESVANRGLGLPLMVALMDEVRFARAPGGGTKVSLSVLLGQGTLAPA